MEGPPRGALFKGEERYFIDRAIELCAAAATGAGFEVSRHDAADPEFSAARLFDDLGAAPLFASARCVIVRNADPLLKKSENKPSPLTRCVVAFLESGREGSVVIAGRSIRVDHPAAKAILKVEGAILTARKLWDSPPAWDPDPRKSELALWVRARAGELSLSLSPDDAAYIAAATGNDLAAIDSQLEKVRRGGGQKLRELISWQSGGNPWRSADELLGGNPGRGLAALESLFQAGFHSDREGKTEVNPVTLTVLLLGALRSKARQALVGSRALARGAPLAEAAELAGVPGRPQARTEFERAVRERSPAAWLAIYRDVADLERKSRTSAVLDVNDFSRLALRWRYRNPRPNQSRR